MNRTLISALSLATLLAVPAFAGHPGGGPPPGDFRGGDPEELGARMAEHQSERLTRALDLTTEQQATLADLQRGFGDTVRPLFESMRTARQELDNALEAAHPDPATVGTKAIAMHDMKEAMKAAHDSFEAGIEAMLTDVQRAQYQALREARPDRDRFRGFAARQDRHERHDRR
ncbi:MAG: Spy/CpxP family protein refolding chaperone [Thermoanaerobaculia bacterium]